MRAPRRPISSCTVKTPNSGNGGSPDKRSTSSEQPTRSSNALPLAIRRPNSWYSVAKAAYIPGRTSFSASSFDDAPMSMNKSFAGTGLDRSPALVRCAGLMPMTPGISSGPTRTAFDGSTRSSMPPTFLKRSRPSLSTRVIMRPISSMWAAIMRRGPGLSSPFHVMRLPMASTLPPSTLSRTASQMRRRTRPSSPDTPDSWLSSRKIIRPPLYVLFAQGRGRVGQQARGVAHVLDVDHLEAGVHVPQRDGHDRGGHAAAHHLHGPGVGARTGRHRLDLVRDAVQAGGFHQQLVQLGVHVGAQGDGGPPAHLDDVVLRQPRRRAETDVHGDGRVRHDAVRAHHGSAQAHFLLHRGHRVHVGRVP